MALWKEGSEEAVAPDLGSLNEAALTSLGYPATDLWLQQRRLRYHFANFGSAVSPAKPEAPACLDAHSTLLLLVKRFTFHNSLQLFPNPPVYTFQQIRHRIDRTLTEGRICQQHHPVVVHVCWQLCCVNDEPRLTFVTGAAVGLRYDNVVLMAVCMLRAKERAPPDLRSMGRCTALWRIPTDDLLF